VGSPYRLTMLSLAQRQLSHHVSWGLLFVWLFLGGVALVEQIAPLHETSSQDERALVRLGSGLKPEAPTLNHTTVKSISIDAREQVLGPAANTVHTPYFPSQPPGDPLSLHQRISVYRI
jgi:hypothetical protein